MFHYDLNDDIYGVVLQCIIVYCIVSFYSGYIAYLFENNITMPWGKDDTGTNFLLNFDRAVQKNLKFSHLHTYCNLAGKIVKLFNLTVQWIHSRLGIQSRRTWDFESLHFFSIDEWRKTRIIDR